MNSSGIPDRDDGQCTGQEDGTREGDMAEGVLLTTGVVRGRVILLRGRLATR